MQVVAMLMAGGAGTRLTALSDYRAKPAVPFAGKFRIIDFTLSNCVNSGIYDIAVLTQYRPHSLNTHIGIGKPWDLDRQRGGVHLRQPYLGRAASDWYRGTADAVYQNIDFILDKRADTVLVLSGDHIYKMDYLSMLAYHEKEDADLTVAVRNVPLEETDRFGIMTVDDADRVIEFTEKPPNRDKGTLASMGIYVFNTHVLLERLETMHAEMPDLDFGKHIIPSMIGQARVQAHRFDGYWVDVGTVHAYWETNLEMAQPVPPLDLYDLDWVIHTRDQERPPAKIGPQGQVSNSLISNGCVIRGAVEHSVLSPGVYVSPGAVVREAVVLDDTWIGPGALVDRAILDADVVVGPGTIVGHGDDFTPNHQQPDRLSTGITVVGERVRIPAGTSLGRNVLIHPHRSEKHFSGTEVPSGETV
ncbi:MAG: glucose-1-phosphate adenylyltransferase [Anaerolineales bacterium]|nr:MAG: glucose-1-phosphate adenylyltransferase [Anaerolineales bacterium]